ncbi:MAG: S46 family peptidase [Bacteroidales bacterium]|jgi:hypothetical protein|nr:S46 family peptidase [Bacteroidales bacterium]
MKKYLFMLLLAVMSGVYADEGMWLPHLLKNNELDMQRKGLKLRTEQIYSEDSVSLKDAIVKFGGGCTGEIVSDKGLVFTNHHCGFDAIQQLSTVENNHLENGFWANSFDEELYCKGLTVTLLVKMTPVNFEIPLGLSERERNDTIRAISKCLVEEATRGTHYKAEVVPFYGGNEYYLMINEVFEDIRLVGTPPVSIGKFGGDTDNWMWPRHTGDFSIFRIYADSSNKPAPYSADNKPYKPLKYLQISLSGVNEGDFTFVFGYPARTQEFLSSFGVKQIVEVEDPLKIAARTKRLDIIKNAMATDTLIRLQYAAKAANIANGWKKWQGEVLGVKRRGTIADKEKFQAAVTDQNLLDALALAYKDIEPYKKAAVYFTEYELAPEVMRFAYNFGTFTDTAIMRDRAREFFKNYNATVDKEIFKALAGSGGVLAEGDGTLAESDGTLAGSDGILAGNDGTLAGSDGILAGSSGAVAGDKIIDNFYNKSIFTDKKRLLAQIEKNPSAIIKDPLYVYAKSRFDRYNTSVKQPLALLEKRIDSLQRIYIRLQMTPTEEVPLVYADANFTLRISYGHVGGFEPADGVWYEPFSTLDGVIEKGDMGIYDYIVLPALKSTTDYGKYSRKDGKMPVCFIATNHTTGGNSGSPVLNASGELTGLNFDRCWEGTMSDIDYDPAYCRNICLDIRYLLFIVDKIAGCKHILTELDVR